MEELLQEACSSSANRAKPL